MSLEEFEKQMREQTTGHEMEIIQLKNHQLEKEFHIKNKAAFRLDNYEIALRELKLRNQKTLE